MKEIFWIYSTCGQRWPAFHLLVFWGCVFTESFKFWQSSLQVIKSNLSSACSAPPTNVQVSPSKLYTAAFSIGQVMEIINFTCSASGGPTLRYSWAETIAGVTTNITSQTPGTGGKIVNGSRLTIIPQKLSNSIQVTCRVVNPKLPSSFPSRAGQARSNYAVKSEWDIFFTNSHFWIVGPADSTYSF